MKFLENEEIRDAPLGFVLTLIAFLSMVYIFCFIFLRKKVLKSEYFRGNETYEILIEKCEGQKEKFFSYFREAVSNRRMTSIEIKREEVGISRIEAIFGITKDFLVLTDFSKFGAIKDFKAFIGADSYSGKGLMVSYYLSYIPSMLELVLTSIGFFFKPFGKIIYLLLPPETKMELEKLKMKNPKIEKKKGLFEPSFDNLNLQQDLQALEKSVLVCFTEAVIRLEEDEIGFAKERFPEIKGIDKTIEEGGFIIVD